MQLTASREFTDHCSVQIRGDVEDFVQPQCRVDAFVLFANAERERERERLSD